MLRGTKCKREGDQHGRFTELIAKLPPLAHCRWSYIALKASFITEVYINQPGREGYGKIFLVLSPAILQHRTASPSRCRQATIRCARAAATDPHVLRRERKQQRVEIVRGLLTGPPRKCLRVTLRGISRPSTSPISYPDAYGAPTWLLFWMSRSRGSRVTPSINSLLSQGETSTGCPCALLQRTVCFGGGMAKLLCVARNSGTRARWSEKQGTQNTRCTCRLLP